MVRVVLASNNQGKIREIRQLVHETNIEIILQTELGVPPAEETGQTFIENALIKARQAAAMTSLPAIADDSGLVVPALNGEPGVFSARYAGESANSQKNIEKLLKNLGVQRDATREAYFYCVIVLLRQAADPCPVICEGKWEGKILSAPRGDKGFGYDPIFFDETYQCSAAQLPLPVKNKISHRGQAMSKLLHFIAACHG
jgi:XTP/dITP diphosphohydrolase